MLYCIEIWPIDPVQAVSHTKDFQKKINPPRELFCLHVAFAASPVLLIVLAIGIMPMLNAHSYKAMMLLCKVFGCS